MKDTQNAWRDDNIIMGHRPSARRISFFKFISLMVLGLILITLIVKLFLLAIIGLMIFVITCAQWLFYKFATPTDIELKNEFLTVTRGQQNIWRGPIQTIQTIEVMGTRDGGLIIFYFIDGDSFSFSARDFDYNQIAKLKKWISSCKKNQ